MPRRDPRQWNVDIDRYLNPLMPSPPWSKVPKPVSHFFGHRATAPAKMGNVLPILWAFIGIFGAIAIIEVVSSHIPRFQKNGVPVIVGSLVSLLLLAVGQHPALACRQVDMLTVTTQGRHRGSRILLH